jgi:hypothetical protein
LSLDAGWNGIAGSLATCSAVVKIDSWNWVARSVVHGTPDSAMLNSAARLDAT